MSSHSARPAPCGDGYPRSECSHEYRCQDCPRIIRPVYHRRPPLLAGYRWYWRHAAYDKDHER